MRKKIKRSQKDIQQRYLRKHYLFICNRCSKTPREKSEFKIINFKRLREAVLRCMECNHIIARSLKTLDQQVGYGIRNA